ncbi:hypothetical protein [Rhizomonospora bruguierae]|uniref:hypothetical protein n=1 Tax=Rhizomonospora bruguierae TaxID=1581705 RepID=UPI001BCB8ACA|nr:hypothetical protein [Micromonospora sp. NBRC 107566]
MTTEHTATAESDSEALGGAHGGREWHPLVLDALTDLDEKRDRAMTRYATRVRAQDAAQPSQTAASDPGRAGEGDGSPDTAEAVVAAAIAWRKRITSHPNLWADDEDFALIAAVDALPAEQVA